MAAPGPGWAPASWPSPRPPRPRRTSLIITLPVMGVIAAVAFGLLAWHIGTTIGNALLGGRLRAPAHYAWTCRVVPNGPQSSPLTGYSPTVVIQNRSSGSLLVARIWVAIFNPAGSQVASVSMVNPRRKTTYIGPGAFYTFTDDHGESDRSWKGTCRVESLQP